MSGTKDPRYASPYAFWPTQGLHNWMRPLAVGRDYWSALQNVDLRRFPSLSSSLGDTAYETPYSAPAMTLHRYTKRDGTREILAYHDDGANFTLDHDSDDGSFSTVYTYANTADDGYLRMTQWKDCVVVSSPTMGTGFYNSGATDPGVGGTPLAFFFPNLSGTLAFGLAAAPFTLGKASTGGFLADGVYTYLFTQEIFQGEVYLGESHPIHNYGGVRSGDVGEALWDLAIRNYWAISIDTASGTATNLINIQKNWTGQTTNFAQGTKYINVYRVVPFLATGTTPPTVTKPQYSAFLVGTINLGTVNTGATASGATIFTDDGAIPLGEQIEYGKSLWYPESRHIEKHKARLWMGYTRTTPFWAPTTHRYNPDRLYFSEPDAPAQINEQNYLTIATNGEGITGIHSFYGRELLVLSPSATWGIYGADDELAPGVPDLYTNKLSHHGCIAPQSYAEVDGGAVWLAKGGPVIYDGERIQELASDRVRTLINAIPKGRRYAAVGWYDRKEAQYHLAVTYDDGTTGAATANRYEVVFDFRTSTWSGRKRRAGVGSAVVVGDTDQDDYVLLGRSDSILTSSFAAIVRMNDGPTQEGPVDGNEAVDFSATTGYIDCGLPHDDKRFTHVVIRYRSPVAITVSVTVFLSQRANVTVNKTLPASTVSTDDDSYVLALDDACQGKAIQLGFSADNTGAQIEIQPPLLIQYQPIGVRS